MTHSFPETHSLSHAVIEKYQGLYHQLMTRAAAEQLWNVVLTTDQRRLLGQDFLDAMRQHPGGLHMWMHLHPDVTGEQAVIDVAFAIGQLAATDRDWLLREMLNRQTPVQVSDNLARNDCPTWNRAAGKLLWNGEIIRKVRTQRNSNIVRILDAFEEEGWPPRIDDPLPGNRGSQRMRDAIRTLNMDQTRIRFSSDGEGSGIRWQTVANSHTASTVPR